MTTDTREPALALRHPWFLDLYADLLRAPDTAARQHPKGRDIDANQNYGYGFRCVVRD